VLSGDDSDERSCRAIPEEACTSVPRNFLLNLVNGCATKLAEQLAGPNLVVLVMLAPVGAPVSLVALLMPLKQADSRSPQLAAAGQIRAFSLRKWFWTAAGSIQSLRPVLMGVAVVSAPPILAGASVVLLRFVLALPGARLSGVSGCGGQNHSQGSARPAAVQSSRYRRRCRPRPQSHSGIVLLGLGAFAGAVPLWAYRIPFLLGGVAEAGARVSRKTYPLDIAPADDRPLHTAFSNTLAGGIALARGLLGVVASLAGVGAAVAALSGFAPLGALHRSRATRGAR